jgi:hypothetical protein
MPPEELLLQYWRELAPADRAKVLQFTQALALKSSAEFIPKTQLGQTLWKLRQRAIAKGMKLLNEVELEQEIADRRGRYRVS